MNDRLSGAEWFKSTYSGADKACVEVAFLAGGAVGIRDSKNPAGPALVVDPAVWDSFLDSVAGR
ncbi:DUF397 domain-containing protein [Nocardia jinanensis]|uniref:DUF397 domain-containing protein n=1 Tax=Nocardia jinanensis TaxID=382504 RepID=A0A917VX20_9NOCA|nr:DUF397 domain-containing protein [Nocardia jinanensis]GGL25372.1 hypothetical protein GCM10011588_45260 [Nocardia jinanensis]